MEKENRSEYYHLEELSHSDYEIADGEPNIKGWDIKDRTGFKLAEVDELLFNPSTRKVRYLIAALEARVFGIENKKVMVPIGLAELHEKDDDVYLPEITIAQLAGAPEYIRGEFNLQTEISNRNVLKDEENSPEVYDEQTFYEHDHYNERNFYGRRFAGRGHAEDGF